MSSSVCWFSLRFMHFSKISTILLSSKRSVAHQRAYGALREAGGSTSENGRPTRRLMQAPVARGLDGTASDKERAM